MHGPRALKTAGNAVHAVGNRRQGGDAARLVAHHSKNTEARISGKAARRPVTV